MHAKIKPSLSWRFFGFVLPLSMIEVGFGLQTYSAHRHHATGEMILFGTAFLALLALALSYVLWFRRGAARNGAAGPQN